MKKFIYLLQFAILAWIFSFIYFLSLIPTKQNIQQANYQADGIVIFTGDNNRIETGLQLFSQNDIKYLLISGVAPGSNFEQIIQNFEHKALYLQKKEFIELGKKATSTIGNINETAQWIKSKNIKSIILVTSNYHLPRSYALFKKRLNPENITTYPTFSDKFDLNSWWKDPKSIELILVEFHKYLICKIALFF